MSTLIAKTGKTARNLGSTVHELANRGIAEVGDASARAQKELSRCARSTRRYVSNEPLKSTLIATGIGALLATLLLTALRSRED